MNIICRNCKTLKEVRDIMEDVPENAIHIVSSYCPSCYKEVDLYSPYEEVFVDKDNMIIRSTKNEELFNNKAKMRALLFTAMINANHNIKTLMSLQNFLGMLRQKMRHNRHKYVNDILKKQIPREWEPKPKSWSY